MSIRILGVRLEGGRCALTGERCGELLTVRDDAGGAAELLVSVRGCFNLNLWLYSLVEAWAWQRAEAELVDRSASPWDSAPRRPSHADKRKALQREVLQGEIGEALAGRPSKEKIRALAQRLLDLAAGGNLQAVEGGH
jgi:hypothetical protein